MLWIQWRWLWPDVDRANLAIKLQSIFKLGNTYSPFIEIPFPVSQMVTHRGSRFSSKHSLIFVSWSVTFSNVSNLRYKIKSRWFFPLSREYISSKIKHFQFDFHFCAKCAHLVSGNYFRCIWGFCYENITLSGTSLYFDWSLIWIPWHKILFYSMNWRELILAERSQWIGIKFLPGHIPSRRKKILG